MYLMLLLLLVMMMTMMMMMMTDKPRPFHLTAMFVCLLSRRSRQRERLSASVLSICSSVCLFVCLSVAKIQNRDFLKN